MQLACRIANAPQFYNRDMRVTVGGSGGIAAYKAAELVRALQKQGAEVHVVMTEAAQKIIQPLTFASLTGHKVLPSLWDDYTAAKNVIFGRTHSPHSPWTVVKSNDKKRARLEAMRSLLAKFDYDGKDDDVIGEPDKAIIGPPSVLSEHNPDRVYPEL